MDLVALFLLLKKVEAVVAEADRDSQKLR